MLPVRLGAGARQAQPISAAFSSSQHQQIREAFLRAGPGREYGASFRKGQLQQHIPATSDALTEADDDSHDIEEDYEAMNEASALPTASLSPLSVSSSTSPKQPFQYKEIVLLETDFRERFIKGGGNGGQKINKTNSNVELKHYETGIVVQCQATRSLPQNRKLARKILISRLDEYYNGDMSKRGQKADKIRQKKMRMARKSAKKYHGGTESGSRDEDDRDFKSHGEERLAQDGDGADSINRKTKLHELSPQIKIILTTLKESLASYNKKLSRRKAGRKE
ncbi:hypothetical protein EDD11_007536 [Mortierella claussenii]|nr:hypothetical protein EDD11_007536 [Mortierella claussenii]